MKIFYKKIIFTITLIFLSIFIIEFFSLSLILGSKVYNRIFDTNFYTPTKPHHLPHPTLSFLKKKDANSFDKTVIEFDINHYSYSYQSNLRNKSLFRSKQNNEVFIYLMGGSTVEGPGRKNFSETIPGLFENILNNNIKCKKFVVFNQGIGGHDTKLNFFHMITKIIPHGRPDMIINMQGVNNFAAYMGKKIEKINNNDKKEIYKYLTFAEYITLKKFSSKPLFKNIIEFIEKKFFLGHLLSSLSIYIGDNNYAHWYKNNKNVEFDINPGLHNYFYYLDLSKTVAENYKIKFYSFLQPVLIYKNKLTNYEAKVVNADKDTGHLQTPSIKLDIYNGFFNRFKKYYKKLEENPTFQNKNWYFDISKLFKNENRLIFEDNIHYSKLGNQIIANEIFTNLKIDMNDFCK